MIAKAKVWDLVFPTLTLLNFVLGATSALACCSNGISGFPSSSLRTHRAHIDNGLLNEAKLIDSLGCATCCSKETFE